MTWLLCDYGEVISTVQPDTERAALVAASGRMESDFWLDYWQYRPPYDRGDVSARAYWEAVIGASVRPDRLRELIARDVRSWLHANELSLVAATRAAERGYRLALFSNAPVEVAAGIDTAPWMKPFDPRIFSCDLREIKPHPAAYELVLARLTAQPSEVIFFDDRSENVAAAAALGIQAHRFTDPAQFDALPAL